ncbi:MAG: hypothetical protein LBC81_03950 [Tannerellaceae bacterium]|nr:hypothetical protein [Tannerellaceae bacterium]
MENILPGYIYNVWRGHEDTPPAPARVEAAGGMLWRRLRLQGSCKKTWRRFLCAQELL